MSGMPSMVSSMASGAASMTSSGAAMASSSMGMDMSSSGGMSHMSYVTVVFYPFSSESFTY